MAGIRVSQIDTENIDRIFKKHSEFNQEIENIEIDASNIENGSITYEKLNSILQDKFDSIGDSQSQSQINNITGNVLMATRRISLVNTNDTHTTVIITDDEKTYTIYPTTEDQIKAIVDWGDKSELEIFYLNEPVSHTYTENGSYNVSYNVIE